MALQVVNSKGELVIDPYRSKEKFNTNSLNQLSSFPEKEAKIIKQYVEDMRRGRNVNGHKGKRGYAHLRSLISRLRKIDQISQNHFGKNLLDLEVNEIHDLFDGMREGKIKKADGKLYKSTNDYIKIFKAFWNWHLRVNRKEGKEIKDITIDLSGSADHKPDFVYFTIESLKKMINYSKFDYKVMMLFMFDTGIRAPTEFMNVKRKDITKDAKSDKLFLNIREETSKTFGRKIKLMLCSDLLRQYMDEKQFKPDDFLFNINPATANLYLKRLSLKVFGEKLKNLPENESNKQYITLYDFRHSSCCYWLPRYKNESALKYRFGWKKSDMIYYYSEFLGMKDTIEEDDMLVDVTKTEIEKELEKAKEERYIVNEELDAMRKQLKEINEFMDKMTSINPEVIDILARKGKKEKAALQS